MTDNEIHLYMMSTINLLILFCVWIKVKKVKRSQFDTVWMMLKRCVIRKVIMQSFHSCNNILSNSYNQFTKKINDMLMSVRDEKILLVKKITQMKSLQIVTTSDQINWLHQVEYSSSSQVLNSSRLDLNQNS